MNILREIASYKKIEINSLRKEFKKLSSDMRPRDPIPFPPQSPFIIAEVKAASPSAGRILPEDFSPSQVANTYKENGADAISVVVDRKYFSGDPCWIREIAKLEIPVLFKEFIVDPWQIDLAFSLGADIILLIATILSSTQLKEFMEKAYHLGLTTIVEVHSKEDLEKTLELNPKIVGINNRDLTTFKVNINTTANLLSGIPDFVTVISESGIETTEEIKFLRKKGVKGFLIGTSLLRSDDPGRKLKELKNAVVD